MPSPWILVSSYECGVFSVVGETVRRELADRSVRGLAPGTDGSVLAIVDGHSVFRRSSGGDWTELVRSELDLSCCVAIGDCVYAGTDDARIVCVRSDGGQRLLGGLGDVDGRDTWYAGTAVIDGKVMGPPLGIRSIAATCDGSALLANVHVGGIPRSIDGGTSWNATIEIDADVHQVATHPERSKIATAAAAVGLCSSRDGGGTWAIEARGLHAPHCSAVAFGRRDVYVSAATDPFAERGAVYRRPIDGDGPLHPIGGGLPDWLAGGVDTGGIAACGATIAVIDRSGALHVSYDDGTAWSALSDRFPAASGVYVA